LDAESRDLLRSLLTEERLLSLAVTVDGEPVAGLLPYAVAPDFTALVVQASGLARHTRGMASGASYAAVIHRPDDKARDPLQIPRLTVEGRVRPLTGDREEMKPALRAFLGRFPAAAATLALPDFTLFRLEIAGGRLVGGFAQAVNLSRSHFEALAKS
jgi:putative heme iron utilization protein